MPGAAGLKVANYVYNVAPKDGTVIGAISGATPTGTLLSQEGAQYDPTKAKLLGSGYNGSSMLDFCGTPRRCKNGRTSTAGNPLMGTQSLGSSSADFTIVSNAVLGTKIKLILGYKSSGEVSLAIERGEVMGNFATAYSSLKSQGHDMFEAGQYKIFIQHGLSKIPELPDVPF